MTTQFQKSFFPELEETTNIDDWTFNGASTRELTHCYHDYPARMIPQVAAKLFYMYGNAAELIFDPYCGTGTSLVEGLIKGINGIGTDLNPLACLIARTKTMIIEPDKVYRYILEFDLV
jgi:DNA modification methylase